MSPLENLWFLGPRWLFLPPLFRKTKRGIFGKYNRIFRKVRSKFPKKMWDFRKVHAKFLKIYFVKPAFLEFPESPKSKKVESWESTFRKNTKKYKEFPENKKRKLDANCGNSDWLLSGNYVFGDIKLAKYWQGRYLKTLILAFIVMHHVTEIKTVSCGIAKTNIGLATVRWQWRHPCPPANVHKRSSTAA